MAGNPPDSPPPPNSGRRLRRTPWRTSCRTQARNEKRTLRWTDLERISQSLLKNHPTVNPEPISAIDLLKLIVGLPFFSDTPHPPNGMYIDLIREAWLDAMHPSNKLDAESDDLSPTHPKSGGTR